MIRGSRITSFEFCFTLERVAAAAAVEMIWPPIFSRVAEERSNMMFVLATNSCSSNFCAKR